MICKVMQEFSDDAKLYVEIFKDITEVYDSLNPEFLENRLASAQVLMEKAAAKEKIYKIFAGISASKAAICKAEISPKALRNSIDASQEIISYQMAIVDDNNFAIDNLEAEFKRLLDQNVQ